MKFKTALLICLLLAFNFAYADWNGGMKKVYSVRIENVTGDRQTTIIPTTTIRPGVDKLVGWSIMPYFLSGNYESYLTIVDSTDAQLNDEVFDEVEAMSGAGAVYWDNPRWIENGVVVSQGSNTTVQIHFIKD